MIISTITSYEENEVHGLRLSYLRSFNQQGPVPGYKMQLHLLQKLSFPTHTTPQLPPNTVLWCPYQILPILLYSKLDPRQSLL